MLYKSGDIVTHKASGMKMVITSGNYDENEMRVVDCRYLNTKNGLYEKQEFFHFELEPITNSTVNSVNTEKK